MMLETPSPNGDNGRDAGGRFAPGNGGGPGNPFARRVAQLRTVLLEAVSDEDLKAVVLALVNGAKGGDVPAAKVLLAYAVGEPAASRLAVSASVQINQDNRQDNRSLDITPERQAEYGDWMRIIREGEAVPALSAKPAGGNGEHGGNGDGQH